MITETIGQYPIVSCRGLFNNLISNQKLYMKKLTLIYSMAGLCVFAIVCILSCQKKEALKQEGNAEFEKSVKAASGATTNAVTSFVHPGIINTQESLDIACSEANNGNQARLAAYQYVLNYCNQHSPSNGYKANVGVAGGSITQDEANFKGDALLSYALALRWAKTGNASYATTARQILNGWAAAFRTMVVTSGSEAHQPDLEASWAAPTFAAAAEILKYYITSNGQTGGWTTANNTQFVTFLNRLKTQYIDHVASRNHQNNWDVSAGYAKMAIGIFEDNQSIFQDGMNQIKTMLPVVIHSDGSMPGEICGYHNDCVHFQYALTGFSYAANLGAMQGDASIYTASNSRLHEGYKYQYRFYKQTLSNPPQCVTCSTGSMIWPGIENANRRYNSTETNFLHGQYNPSNDGLPNGDLSFLCWTNFTHNNVFP